MKKVLLVLLFISSLFAREYIAVIDFEGIGVSNDEARVLTQRLTSELINIGVYQVLERSEMKRLLDEQKFQYSGCVDLKCAVELGKMLGAKYMVVGTISKLGRTFTVDSRLIYVESGEAYSSGKYTTQSSIDNVVQYGMASIAYQLSDEDIPDEILNHSESIFSKIYKQRKIISIVSFILWIGWGLLPA
jgi:TolB-like protein